jgi:hypothetical protein
MALGATDEWARANLDVRSHGLVLVPKSLTARVPEILTGFRN